MPASIRVLVDAAFDRDLEMAGLAAVADGYGVVAADVLPAGSSLEAEILAVIRGCCWLSSRAAPNGSRLFTDCQPVYLRSLRGAQNRGSAAPAMRELNVMLERHGYELKKGDRGLVKEAHKAAGWALRSWKAGRSGDPTWRRNPYLQPGE